MRTILFILQKEFKQVFRNKIMIPIIFVLPIVQIFLLVYAANLELKNVNIVIQDQDGSVTSRELISHFQASGFFTVKGQVEKQSQAEELLQRGEIHAFLIIPSHLEKDLVVGHIAKVQLIVDGINGMEASLVQGYSQQVIMGCNKDLILEWINILSPGNYKTINVNPMYWYNKHMDYKIYMLPGILAILVTIIGMFLSAFNLVREKEIGTIEQINVTPIQKYQFIIGKLIPFWLIALLELTVGLIFGKLVFNIPILGSIPLLYLFASVYLLVALGIGLVLSTTSETQQQVMFLAFFFMLVFILMSGLFTPVETMPVWAQKINILNPFAYFIRVIRMILLKGSGFSDLKTEFFSLLTYGILILSIAVKTYHKTS